MKFYLYSVFIMSAILTGCTYNSTPTPDNITYRHYYQNPKKSNTNIKSIDHKKRNDDIKRNDENTDIDHHLDDINYHYLDDDRKSSEKADIDHHLDNIDQQISHLYGTLHKNNNQ